MRRHHARPKTVILPIRLTPEGYKALAVLATADGRTRCDMIRRLIDEAAQRSAQMPMKAKD